MAAMERMLLLGKFTSKQYLGLQKSIFISNRSIVTSTKFIDDVQLTLSKRIASRITYQTASTTDKNNLNGPIVLLMPWLMAKQRHIEPFVNRYLYHYRWDVLRVSVHTGHVMFPPLGAQVLAKRVLNVLNSNQFKDRPVLLHGISVGVYIYFEMLVAAARREGCIDNLRKRIVGQIYDSAIDATGAAGGISKSLLEGHFLQSSVEAFARMYVSVMKRPVMEQYARASRMFQNNPINSASLFIYSYADPIGRAEDNENYIRALKENMKYENVHTLVFNDSPHVKHLYTYEKEYLRKLDWFLQSEVSPVLTSKLKSGSNDGKKVIK